MPTPVETSQRERLTLALILLLILPTVAQADTGLATWYSVKSAQSEGTSGTYTASGELYDESAMTCALRSRNFGQRVKVCHADTCITVRQNDYGPGRAATKRGVIVDLSPAAYDALGCKRGVNSKGVAWGECTITVEPVGG